MCVCQHRRNHPHLQRQKVMQTVQVVPVVPVVQGHVLTVHVDMHSGPNTHMHTHRNPPNGSHHSALSRLNFSISAASIEDVLGDGVLGMACVASRCTHLDNGGGTQPAVTAALPVLTGRRSRHATGDVLRRSTHWKLRRRCCWGVRGCSRSRPWCAGCGVICPPAPAAALAKTWRDEQRALALAMTANPYQPR